MRLRDEGMAAKERMQGSRLKLYLKDNRMDTVYTILIWLGSGFAFAVGVCLGAFLMARTWRDRVKADKITADVNDLLRERNYIGKLQANALERIAEAAEAKVP